MSLSSRQERNGAIWIVGGYGTSVALRFGSNVILSRLVVPEVFGVMLIINTLRSGIELLSDVGIGQNIVHNPKGEQRDFLNVAWTIQLLRGLLLFSLLFVVAAPLGQLYQLPSAAIQLSALTLALAGAASVAIYLQQRRLQFARSNLFDLGVDAIGAVLVVGLAWYSPTIWSLIFASILTTAIRTGASYLLPDARNWFAWQRDHALEIIHFGKWIYVSSLLAYLCASFDRLYLGQTIPLALLGIYGVARNIADLPALLFARLGHSLVFPVVAANQETPRPELRQRIKTLRFKLLLLCAVCIALGASIADFAVMIVYDARYQEAGWMLPVMLVGVWVSILCSMNDYALLGLGKPLYGAAGNLTKLICLAIGIPLGLHLYGLLGAILAMALGDVFRYFPILFGQRQEHLSFRAQDLALTALMLGLLAAFTLLRWQLGLGTAFDSVSLR